MKKSLKEIFDGAKREDFDRFSNELSGAKLPVDVIFSIKNRVYSKTKIKKKRKNNKNIWLHIGAVAACFTLIISSFFVFPMLKDVDPSITIPPDTTDNITFDSLDKVNFYGGLKVISDSKQNLSLNTARKNMVSFLNNGKVSYQMINLSETAPHDTFEQKPVENDTTQGSDWLAWELINEQMTITTAVYFKIIVTESDTLLAQKIGQGEAEVVVTDLCIGINPFAMITFKNGENFFSCLTESYAMENGENHFASNLYISGFGMYKELVEETTSFYNLEFDKDNKNVTSLKWCHYNSIPSQSVFYEIEIISQSVSISYDEYIFTLGELEDYWQNRGESTETPDIETEPIPTTPDDTYDGLPDTPMPTDTVIPEIILPDGVTPKTEA